MIARIIWIAALVVIGALTAQLQLDRQSAREAEAAQWVAQPFRAYSQAILTEQHINGDDPARALIEAQRLVERRPMPAEHLTALTKAYIKNGDATAATLSIQSAAQRGWREPLAQETMARLALANDDLAEASRRFVALLVLGDGNEALLSDLAGQIFAEPDSPGLAPVVEVIGDADRWQKLFLRRGPTVMPPDAFAAILQASSEEGARFECALIEQAAKKLRRANPSASEAADTVASLPCSGGRRVRA